MKEMVLSEDFRHMSVRSMALHAQRLGCVFAHPVTWYKMIRDRDWFRPRTRIYPEPTKIGLRTTGPNQAWHVDVTVVRLLGGVRAYVQAVIDNYSRRILSWAVTEKLRGLGTVEVIAAAGRNIGSDSAVKVVMDAGTENVNQHVSNELDVKGFERVIAQIDVEYSNSMIEAWWRSLRHNWLYLHSLASVGQLDRLVGFYVEQHNKVMPHSAFDGQTPDEVFFGKFSIVEAKIQRDRARALRQRLAENRGVRCHVCPRPPPEAQGRAA
jgi:putative transposase